MVLGLKLMMDTRIAGGGPEYEISGEERESVMEIGGGVLIEETV